MKRISWAHSIDFSTPAATLLQALVALLPDDRHFKITVFGDAVLQICVDATLPCAHIDIFSDFEPLGDFINWVAPKYDKPPFFIRVCHELNFETSIRWRDRAQSICIGNCRFVFPHPIDVLIAKLNRFDGKDARLFQTVRAKTGHPTEEELIKELQFAVDLFHPRFEEDHDSDLASNCRWLWPLIYGREINPRTEIIAPALAIRNAEWQSELRS